MVTWLVATSTQVWAIGPSRTRGNFFGGGALGIGHVQPNRWCDGHCEAKTFLLPELFVGVFLGTQSAILVEGFFSQGDRHRVAYVGPAFRYWFMERFRVDAGVGFGHALLHNADGGPGGGDGIGASLSAGLSVLKSKYVGLDMRVRTALFYKPSHEPLNTVSAFVGLGLGITAGQSP